MSEYWEIGGDFKRHRFGKSLTICWNYKIEFRPPTPRPNTESLRFVNIQTCALQNGNMWTVFMFTLILSSPSLSLFLTFLFFTISLPSFRLGTLESSLIMHALYSSTLSETLHLLNVSSVLLLVSFLVLLSLLLFRSLFLLVSSNSIACYLASLFIVGHKQLCLTLCFPVNLIRPGR